MENYGKRLSALIVAWFVVVLVTSALGLFSSAVNGFGIGVGVAASTPIVVFAIWLGMSRQFREFLLQLNPRVLTGIHSMRLLGFVFVLLEAHQLLPARFALPSGYGDMAIGATAILAAWKLAAPQHRGSFMLWQILGVTDLMMAVSLGVTSGLVDPHGISMAPVTTLPLSLIPTFFVPLLLMLHVICIMQAREWKAATQTGNSWARAVNAVSGV